MSDWREVKLGDISSYSDDRISMDQINLTNYISTENMNPNRDGVTIASSLPSAKTVTKYFCDDILISNIRPYFKKIWFADKEGGCSNDVLVIRNNHLDKVDSKYLYYCLFTDHFFEYVMSGAKGAKMPRGDREEIMKYPLSLPPFKIQKKIASILSNIDSKIDINHKINKTLEDMAMTLYKHWFIDFGPFQEGEFEDSEIGMIPKGWKVKSLNEVANIQMGQSPKSEFYNSQGEGLPFHQGVKDFGERFPNHVTYCTQELRVANDGDILLSVRAPVGRINVSDTKIVIGRGLSALNSKTNHHSFILYSLKRVFYVEDQYGSGTVFNSVTKNDLEKIKVLLPNIEILTSFEKTVREYDELYKRNYLELRGLKQIRDYLLTRLLSGEIDLTKLDIEAV